MSLVGSWWGATGNPHWMPEIGECGGKRCGSVSPLAPPFPGVADPDLGPARGEGGLAEGGLFSFWGSSMLVGGAGGAAVASEGRRPVKQN